MLSEPEILLRYLNELRAGLFWKFMYATAEQSSEEILQLYYTAGENTEAALREVGLEGSVTVPWWSEGSRHISLRRLMVHMIAEAARHLGQVDIRRERIDGKAGMFYRADNLPDAGAATWAAHRAMLQSVAQAFR